ncbi:MAG: DMT family transporter, partial [Clostridia bacterium]|nr:DMT family transporter [Clostridia bacterium]
MKRIGASVYYGMLVLVAIIWGIDPIVNSHLYRYYSASALSALSTCFTAILFLILSRKKLRLLNRDYLKISLPISLLNSLACLLQRIGLQYTSPAKYSFLEHLSCIVVPILAVFCLRKKPHPIQWIASVLCLGGCLILTGAGTEAVTLGVGELLCALAGILFGVCIVTTGAFTKKLNLGMHMTIHMLVYFLTSFGLMLLLDHMSWEPLCFSW